MDIDALYFLYNLSHIFLNLAVPTLFSQGNWAEKSTKRRSTADDQKLFS